jgi:Tfp pilus assembly protein PilE
MTLAELITTALILAIMMAIAAPTFLAAVNAAQQDDCHANMEAIANAEEQYRIKSAGHAYTTRLSDLSSLVPGVPVCPGGGTYQVTLSDGTAKAQNGQTVPKGGLVVSCSLLGHGKYAPGIDTP